MLARLPVASAALTHSLRHDNRRVASVNLSGYTESIVGIAIDILQPFGHLLNLLSDARFVLTIHLLPLHSSACSNLEDFHQRYLYA